MPRRARSRATRKFDHRNARALSERARVRKRAFRSGSERDPRKTGEKLQLLFSLTLFPLSPPPQLRPSRPSTAKRADGTMLASMNLRSTGKSSVPKRLRASQRGGKEGEMLALFSPAGRLHLGLALIFRDRPPLRVLDWNAAVRRSLASRSNALIVFKTLAMSNCKDKGVDRRRAGVQ